MDPFTPGQHRAIYLWAGPSAIRMNRLKFMNAAVDEQVHLDAHSPIGASIAKDEMALNWAYLMYDWGFPPEIEKEDFQSFQQAVHSFHTRGIKVFAYIQTSNCVFQGSYQEKDWYALDPSGRKIHYYTGRYMTCWQNPDWIANLENLVKLAVETGADGVFFDNPWYGEQLLNLSGIWFGAAGCYCPRCRKAYNEAAGAPIPETFFSINDAQAKYIQWRAGQNTHLMQHLADTARSLNPDILISINNFDAVMRPAYLIYGIDLPALARIQDTLMVEDYGLPRYEVSRKTHWVNNVLTIHTAAGICRDTPISVDPYDRGIGFDSVYPARRYQQGLAEAAACGANMVIKGTEFFDQGKFTLLTAPQFREVRTCIKEFHLWMDQHADLYSDRVNLARVGVVFPGDALWKNWSTVASCFFGVGQALLALGIPWRVVSQPTDLEGLDCLVTCDHLFNINWNLPESLKVIALSSLPGWTHATPSIWLKRPRLLNQINRFLSWLYRSYFDSRLVRKVLDGIGIMGLITQSPLFDVPPAAQLARLSTELCVKSPLTGSQPVLVESWQKGDSSQLHLVNYSQKPITVNLEFTRSVTGSCLSPDRSAPIDIKGTFISVPLDIYNVLVFHE